MRKTALISILLTLCFLSLKAQKEDYIWYFGDSVILDFNTITPTASQDAHLWAWESSASICDSSGSLLFYMSHQTIYDSSKSEMLNGWSGFGINTGSITQGSLILPTPEKDSQFYVFRIEYAGAMGQRLRFSTVDMSMSGGLGAVIIKDSLIYDVIDLTEKMAAVKHANGKDWWLLVHWDGSDRFMRYLIDSGGISGPWFQIIGQYHSAAAGEMAFSEDGSKLAVANVWGLIDYFHFDRCSGLLSDHIVVGDEVPGSGSGSFYYGCAFSPNNQFFYVSTRDTVFQFDSEAPSIPGSKILIYADTVPTVGVGQLELGPNGKIYAVAGSNLTPPYDPLSQTLHVIHDPDLPGLLCNFVPYDLDISPGYCVTGLPNIPNYRLGPWVQQTANAGIDATVCALQGPVTIGTPDTSGCVYAWSPAAGLSDPNIPQPVIDPGAVAAGTYTYILTVTDTTKSGCNVTTDTVTVTIVAAPVADAGRDTVLCGATMPFGIGGGLAVPGYTYVWTPVTGLSDAALAQPVLDPVVVADSLMYIVSVYPDGNPGCAVSDTMKVWAAPVAAAGPDTVLCNVTAGDSFVIGMTGSGMFSYLWSPGDALSDSTAAQPVLHPDLLSGRVEMVLTVSNPLQAGCDVRDTVVVTVEQSPVIVPGEDAILCPVEGQQIGPSTSSGTALIFVWSPMDGLDNPYSANPLCTVTQKTVYVVAVTDPTNVTECRTVYDTIQVTIKPCPLQNVMTPNGDGVNDYFVVSGYGERESVTIYDRWGQVVFHSENETGVWDGRTSAGDLVPAGVYYYTVMGDGWDGEKNEGVKAASGSVTVVR